MDCVGVDAAESVTASRKNYDVGVRCVSGVRDRYYEPETGRYVTSDPIGLDAGINTFVYVGGMPTKYIDSSGLIKIDKSCKGDCLRSNLEESARQACKKYVSGITNPKIRACVEQRCKNGIIKCDGNCKGSPPYLGYNNSYSVFGIEVSRSKKAVICINLGNKKSWGVTAVHEWAHSCGYGTNSNPHPPGSGVPSGWDVLKFR